LPSGEQSWNRSIHPAPATGPMESPTWISRECRCARPPLPALEQLGASRCTLCKHWASRVPLSLRFRRVGRNAFSFAASGQSELWGQGRRHDAFAGRDVRSRAGANPQAGFIFDLQFLLVRSKCRDSGI